MQRTLPDSLPIPNSLDMPNRETGAPALRTSLISALLVGLGAGLAIALVLDIARLI